MIGCSCAQCTSSDPKNKRLRPSALLKVKDTTLLIDTGPDLREQALRYHIDHLDGVLLTHTHYDHIAGIDELRVYYLGERKPLPVLLSQTTIDELKIRYSYLFVEKNPTKSLTAQLEFQTLEGKRGKTVFQGVPLSYLTYEQGGMEVTGFRLGNLAYLSDLCNYEESIFEDLKGVDVLIISALRHGPSSLHLTVEEAIQFAKETGVSKTYFMHLSHELDYHETNNTLPEGIELAYDGLEVEFEI